MHNGTMRRLLSAVLAVMMVCVSFGMIASDNAQAAFIQPLSNTGLPSTFTAYDTAWNEAGTMAVVVGHEAASLSTNAYAYYPNNDTYWPINNNGYHSQSLHAVDYFSQPVYDYPTILVVNADYSYNGVVNFYANALTEVHDMRGVNAQLWQVWDYDFGTVVQGKPTAQDMAPYDLVIWAPTKDMWGRNGNGDALNPQDMQEIAQYMNGGGNFFLSNQEFSTYTAFGGPGSFTHDYLGLGGLSMTTNYEYGVRPASMDLVFGDLPETGQNWNTYGWLSPESKTDLVSASLGTNCFECYDGGMWGNTGVRYDSGTHKSLFLGFPLETVGVSYASAIISRMLDWIEEPSPDQASEYMGNLGFVNAGIITDDPWAQSFIPSQEHIAMAQFFMYKQESGSDYFLVEVYADEGGEPSGLVLTYGYIYSEDVPLDYSNSKWVDCIFENGGATLTPGLQYWLKCSRFNYGPAHMWGVDYDRHYSEGEARHYSGGIWQWLSYDFVFRTFTTVSEPASESIVTIYPSKDTTIYQAFTVNGNGAGDYLISGMNSGGWTLRALLEFDVASKIPKYSRITGASLTLYSENHYNMLDRTLSLHPIYEEWGESTSDGPEQWEDYGAWPTAMGDATWNYRYYDTNSWSSNGGTYDPAYSASKSVGMVGAYTWSSNKMINNVQSWVQNPDANHGWLLKESEIESSTAKWFNSKDHPDPMSWPKLTITYIEPQPIGYMDVFWIVGDRAGAPPSNIYKFVPSEGMQLNQFMSPPVSSELHAIALDGNGHPMCGGGINDYVYYHDGDSWISLSSGEFDEYYIKGIDFNANDDRFYLSAWHDGSPNSLFYSDPLPFESGISQCYRFNGFTGTTGNMNSIAWNQYYNYGLVAEGTRLLKVWPYSYHGNGDIKYETIAQLSQYNFRDISWDSDGWNEAGIVGTYSTSKMYWRYYHTNPQILEGFNGMAGTYYTCAFKPPSSPKWLFIPSGAGSVRVNTEEKDQSGEITVSSEFPHIFTMGMWKQSDGARLSTFNTQVEADSTYTFFVEANYTRSGADYWDISLGIYLQGWFDAGLTGTNSNPGDDTWTDPNLRTRQFNISYMPSTGVASADYPAQVGTVSEFALHSYWEDPATYGPDGSHHRVYINVTFGKQTAVAPGDGAWGTSISWDKNVGLDDANSWDLKVLLSDTVIAESFNASYAEFGVKRYGSISVTGNPSGSIPPGASAILVTPSRITYSSNSPYQLNVSIPNLLKDGNPGIFIPATYVSVLNDQDDADATNSDIWDWTPFDGANNGWCIWGLEGVSMLPPPLHGTVSAGPIYTDYTAAMLALPFQPTPVRWQVVVPAGTPEGVYQATITITMWS